MDYRVPFLALALAFSAPALAGYAQVSPPMGWSPTAVQSAGSAGSFNFGTAANLNSFQNGSVLTNSKLNVGGRLVTIPVNMRYAANASRLAAGFIFKNPYVQAGMHIAAWLGVAGVFYDSVSDSWFSNNPNALVSDGKVYCTSSSLTSYSIDGNCSDVSVPSKFRFHSQSEALNDLLARCNATSNFRNCRLDGSRLAFVYLATNYLSFVDVRTAINCPSGWFVTPAGCTQTAQPLKVTESEFVEKLAPVEMPPAVPTEIPQHFPIEVPEIQPTFVPSSVPKKNPNFDPNVAPSEANPPMVQPGVEVKPAPNPSSPWDVSIIPVNRPVPNPESLPSSEPVPLNPPSGSGTGGPIDLLPSDETLGLCDKYPNILACKNVDDESLEEEKLPESDLDFEFSPVSGFRGNKSCPSFPQIDSLPGLSWQSFCDSLDMIRPLILAFAWFSAALILLGSRRD